MRKRLASTLVLLGLTLGATAPAAADWRATEDRPEMISLTTMTTSAVVVGVIMLTVHSTKKEPTVLRRYLDQNEPAVRAAVALGAGRATTDVAAMFGVPKAHDAAFGRLLRRHRAALLRAAYVDRDIFAVIDIVEGGILMDPVLRRSVREA